MRALLLPALLSILLCNCNRSENKSETYADSLTAQTTDALSEDSIRAIFNRRIQPQLELFPTQQIIEQGKLYPVDEAPLDTAFFVFREQLKDAVKRKDIFFIMEKTDANVLINDQKKGVSAFAQHWGLTSQAATIASPLWAQLSYLLNEGGVFTQNKTQFHAPYFSATFPADLSKEENGVITGAGVRMRSAPSLNSQINKIVSHDLIQILEETPDSTTINEETFSWFKVKTQEDLEGYVWGKFIGRPDQDQVSFQKTATSWKIVKLIAYQP